MLTLTITCFKAIFIFSLVSYEDLKTGDYEYPKWSITVGWILTASSLVCIPAYILYFLAKTPGTFKQVY